MIGVLQQIPWWGWAFLFSLTMAGFALTNEHFRLEGMKLTFWRGLIPFLTLSPVVLFLDFPSSPLFYAATLLAAAIVSYTDTRQFDASAKFGAGVLSRLQPMTVWLLFIFWLAWAPAQLQAYAADPVMAGAIVTALALLVIASMTLRRCAVTRAAFLFLLPTLLMSVIVNLSNKVAMTQSGFIEGIVIYAWIQSLFITIAALVSIRVKRAYPLGQLFTPRCLKAGLIIGVVIVLLNLSKNAAMTQAENPAYVIAFSFLGPLWVILLHRLMRRPREDANIPAGLLLVLSAALLAWATR